MKRISFILSIVSVLGILSSCCLSVLGEAASSGKAPVTTGSIAGAVTDQNGAPLAGATVAITNMQTKESFTVKTDANGEYQTGRLAPGEYQVVISASGLVTKTATTRVKERHTSNVGAHLKPAATPTAPTPAKPS